METLEARFRIVTPMFISGADQAKAELRVPSIKGALRFWWRAISSQRFDGDLGGLRAEEAGLFGSSEQDVGQSKVVIRLRDQRLSIQKKWRPNTWEGYVGYGLKKSVGDQREFIKPGSGFLIDLGFKTELSQGQLASLRQAIITLGIVGGLGGRSRKGWGSLVLETLEGPGVSWSAPSNEDELKRALNELFGSRQDRTPIYTAFSHQARFQLGPVKPTAEQAHRFLAETYKEVVREAAPKSHREQFGLPRSNVGRNAEARRASPVFLHVHELSPGGSAIPLVIFLPAEFLERQSEPSGRDSLVNQLFEWIRDENVNRPR